MENRISKLKSIKRNKKNQSNTDDVKRSFITKSKFPIVIQPVNDSLNLLYWIQEKLPSFEEELLKYGAILFRDFKINTVEKFQELMSVFPNDLLEYKLRSSPRYALTDSIYVSTTYPNELSIEMHSESSYAPSHPKRIVFCCVTPAEKGGETPIADNRLILNYLSEKTKQKFIEKGVQYRRNLNSLLGLPWQEVFQTTDRNIVEKECGLNQMDFEWKNEDALTLKWNKPAIWNHPISKEPVWFNHALFFNKYLLDQSVLSTIESEDDLPNNTYFGDGTEISEEEIKELKNAYNKSITEFTWNKGDVLFLDNMLFSHGRNPYQGQRKIIVSIS